MINLILIIICLLHNRNAQRSNIQLLMIIYTEKWAELYIMHVMTYSGSLTERKEHINRNAVLMRGWALVSQYWNFVCVCVWVFPTVRCACETQHYVITVFVRAGVGKTAQIKEKKQRNCKRKKCEARGGTCQSYCSNVIHSGLVSTGFALWTCACVHLLVNCECDAKSSPDSFEFVRRCDEGECITNRNDWKMLRNVYLLMCWWELSKETLNSRPFSVRSAQTREKIK